MYYFSQSVIASIRSVSFRRPYQSSYMDTFYATDQSPPLSACIAAIGFVPAVYAADNSTVILDTITVKGTRNKDEIGKNRVYAHEIVNLYKSKNEVETFKGNTVSDLLSGMSGVYSGDARNSGALDPNIRGVQGQGRISVTIDGTEQAITVWRGYAGANNRNYVDPKTSSAAFLSKRPFVQP